MTNRILALPLVCGALLLGGCTNFDTQSGAASGAALGGTLGLISGLATGAGTESIIWRTAGGALVGGILGNDLERRGVR